MTLRFTEVCFHEYVEVSFLTSPTVVGRYSFWPWSAIYYYISGFSDSLWGRTREIRQTTTNFDVVEFGQCNVPSLLLQSHILTTNTGRGHWRVLQWFWNHLEVKHDGSASYCGTQVIVFPSGGHLRGNIGEEYTVKQVQLNPFVEHPIWPVEHPRLTCHPRQVNR